MLKLFQKEQRDKIRRLLSIMLPIIGTQIAIIGMYFFDASMSGQAGDVDLAGAAIGGNLWMPVQTGINGVLLAGMPLIAHLLGAGEKDKIKVVVRHGLLLGTFFALLVILGGIIFAPIFLSYMGLAPDVEYVATWYLVGVGIGILPFFLISPLRCLVDTLGYTHLTMKIYMLALPINACLNYVLIFGKFGLPRLGGIGAGVATGLTFWILLLMFLFVVTRLPNFKEYHLFDKVKIAKEVFKEYLKIGVPMGVSIFVETSIFGVVAFLVAKFGTEVIAAHQAALNFSSVVYMVPLSFSLALTIVVGVEAGAKRFEMAKDYTIIGLQMSLLCTCCYVGLEYIWREQVALIYSSNPQVVDITVHFIIYAILWEFSDAVAAPIQGILRGYKDVNATFWAGVFAYWGVALPLGLYFDYVCGWGPDAYWISLIIGITACATALSLRLVWLQKKIKDGKYLEE